MKTIQFLSKILRWKIIIIIYFAILTVCSSWLLYTHFRCCTIFRYVILLNSISGILSQILYLLHSGTSHSAFHHSYSPSTRVQTFGLRLQNFNTVLSKRHRDKLIKKLVLKMFSDTFEFNLCVRWCGKLTYYSSVEERDKLYKVNFN